MSEPWMKASKRIGSECDWGDCSQASVTLRFDSGSREWLPVCREHRQPQAGYSARPKDAPESPDDLIERLTIAAKWADPLGLFSETAALLREASAALPALQAALNADDRASRIIALGVDRDNERVWRERAEDIAYRALDERDEARAEVAALRAQLAGATTITDEMVERAARGMCLYGWDRLSPTERIAYHNSARGALAAALSVPAVPVDGGQK